MDYNKIANLILINCGGKANIKAMEHCATRLRIVAVDDTKLNIEALKAIEGVGGYFFQSGQHQFILGTGTVNKVFDELTKDGSINTANAKEEAYSNLSPFQKGVRSLADVFIPLIPVLVATGLFMGLRGFMEQLGIKLSPQILTLTQVLTDTAFMYLPALVVWSTFTRFGGTPAVGMVLGLMLIVPMIPNAYDVANNVVEPLKLGIFNIKGFQGTIIPALIVGILGARIEKWIKGWMPNLVSLIFTPFLTITLAVSVGFLLIGPIVSIIESMVITTIKALISLPFGIGGAFLGGVGQLIVLTGLHHSLGIIELSYLGTQGVNPLNGILTASMAGQAGAAYALVRTIQNKNERALKYSSIVPCYFGITEPLLFGVTVTNTKIFACGMLGGAVGGAFVAILKIAPPIMGVTFIPAIPAYMGSQLPLYLATIIISMLTAFISGTIIIRAKKSNV